MDNEWAINLNSFSKNCLEITHNVSLSFELLFHLRGDKHLQGRAAKID